MSEPGSSVQVELPVDVLCRLLRDKSLVASEFKSLNTASNQATKLAIKRSITRSHSFARVP